MPSEKPLSIYDHFERELFSYNRKGSVSLRIEAEPLHKVPLCLTRAGADKHGSRVYFDHGWDARHYTRQGGILFQLQGTYATGAYVDLGWRAVYTEHKEPKALMGFLMCLGIPEAKILAAAKACDGFFAEPVPETLPTIAEVMKRLPRQTTPEERLRCKEILLRRYDKTTKGPTAPGTDPEAPAA